MIQWRPAGGGTESHRLFRFGPAGQPAPAGHVHVQQRGRDRAGTGGVGPHGLVAAGGRQDGDPGNSKTTPSTRGTDTRSAGSGVGGGLG
jgi:hypothetical protein